MVGFTGGEKLEAKLREIGDKIQNPGVLRVGFLEDATYDDGKPVAMIAAIQNFGAPAAGIPPRPFFSNMVAEKSPGWGEKMERLLRHTNYDGKAALALMGEGIAGQLRTSIVETNEPPLKPQTVRRKGFAKPLVETGHMLASVGSEVSDV